MRHCAFALTSCSRFLPRAQSLKPRACDSWFPASRRRFVSPPPAPHRRFCSFCNSVKKFACFACFAVQIPRFRFPAFPLSRFPAFRFAPRIQPPCAPLPAFPPAPRRRPSAAIAGLIPAAGFRPFPGSRLAAIAPAYFPGGCAPCIISAYINITISGDRQPVNLLIKFKDYHL